MRIILTLLLVSYCCWAHEGHNHDSETVPFLDDNKSDVVKKLYRYLLDHQPDREKTEKYITAHDKEVKEEFLIVLNHPPKKNNETEPTATALIQTVYWSSALYSEEPEISKSLRGLLVNKDDYNLKGVDSTMAFSLAKKGALGESSTLAKFFDDGLFDQKNRSTIYETLRERAHNEPVSRSSIELFLNWALDKENDEYRRDQIHKIFAELKFRRKKGVRFRAGVRDELQKNGMVKSDVNNEKKETSVSWSNAVAITILVLGISCYGLWLIFSKRK